MSNLEYIPGFNPSAADRHYGDQIARLPARIESLEAELQKAREALEIWRTNSRDTFDAMCAMRNNINEYLPMPSLESDLLQGPESSVFCKTVAETVIRALSQDKGAVDKKDIGER